MIGPVLNLELLLGSRRGRQHIFRRIYTGLIVGQFLFYYWLYLLDTRVLSKLFMISVQTDTNATANFAVSHVNRLVSQQFIFLLLLTPAFAAGAITDEKSRGTLQYLFAADLTSWEIVIGKLLGRTLQIAMLGLTALPFMCFVGVFGGVNLLWIAAVFLVTLTPLFAVGAASILASVWSRQTRDAVLGVYVSTFCSYLLLLFLGAVELFDPNYVLEPAGAEFGDLAEFLKRLFVSVLSWGGVGVACLCLAAWRLRPAYISQLEGEGRPKKTRWWRAQRAAVPDEPIRWKERHVEGVAPFAFLRRMPRWMGVTAIASLTLLASGASVLNNLDGMSATEALTELMNLKFERLVFLTSSIEKYFAWQGIIALLLGSLMVGLRCSGAVTGEREHQTWEALLLTPLPIRPLIRGKLWGIVGASLPYVMAYAVPAMCLSVFGGPMAIVETAVLLGVTWLAMAFIGAAGLWCSVRSKSSWRSMLGTLLFGYGGGFFLLAVAMPVAWMIFLVLMITVTLIDQTYYGGQLGLSRTINSAGGFLLVAVCILLVVGFLLSIKLLLNSAQRYVADRERTRHWKYEPMAGGKPRSRKKIVRVRTSPPSAPDAVPTVKPVSEGE